MSKNAAKFNYWVDLVFLITLVVVIVTGFIIWGWKRPEGMRPGMAPQREASEVARRADDQNAPSELPSAISDNSDADDQSAARAEEARDATKQEEGATKDETPNAVSDARRPGGRADRPGEPGDRAGGQARESAGGQAPVMGEAKIFWGLLKGRTFLGMTKHGWQDVHAWVSMVMILCFLLHLKAHFRWLVVMSKKSEKDVSAPQNQEDASNA